MAPALAGHIAARLNSFDAAGRFYCAERERQAAEAAGLATEFADASPETKSDAEINQVLPELFSAVSNKVGVHQAALLAYTAQLMLQTLRLSEPSAL